MSSAQVLALLPRELEDDTSTSTHSDFMKYGATALVRDDEGRISLETVSPDAAFVDQIMTTGCFRRGKPIFDPVSRQIMGYEMEMIAMPGLSPRYA